jgi:hypothetical protein
VPSKKIYAGSGYEKKLKRVMERLGIEHYNHDWGRESAYVRFEHQGQWYSFEQSKEKSHAHDGKLELGSDCYAQIVLTLEALARATENGLYKIGAFLGDELKMLPPAVEVPACFVRLGFTEMPESEAAVDEKFRRLTRVVHPDSGGDDKEMKALIEAREQAKAYLGGEKT